MARVSLLRYVAIAALLSAAWFSQPATAQTGVQGGYTVQRGAVEQFRRDQAGAITDRVVRPRYSVRLISFHAIDETGPDWSGSDEIFAIYETPAYHAATSVYGDIDTGDTQQVNLRHACVTPAVDPDRRRNGLWRCEVNGSPGPVDFRISLYETDGDVPWNWGACLRGGSSDLVPRADAILCPTESYARVFSFGRTITEAALASLLPEQNTHREFEERGQQYSIVYRIERKTDLVIEQDRALAR